MEWENDYQNKSIRITDERMTHIMNHPEMAGMKREIIETLKAPERVIRSISDEEAYLYYRHYDTTPVGEKYLCVVVKTGSGGSFLLTAYLTDKMKKGEIIWNGK